MFGGYGLYCDELFFALVDKDVLYVKVDAVSRQVFEDEGLQPFSYLMKAGSSATLSYYPLPASAFDDPQALQHWAQLGLAAALRARKPGKPSRH